MRFMCEEMRDGLRVGKKYVRGIPNDPSFVSIHTDTGNMDILVERPYSGRTDVLTTYDCQAEDWEEIKEYDLDMPMAIDRLCSGFTIEQKGRDARLSLFAGVYVVEFGTKHLSFRQLYKAMAFFNTEAEYVLCKKWRVVE